MPKGDLAAAVNATFGSLECFISAFASAAGGNFGSGWTWLVAEADGLEIVNSANADTPLTEGSQRPLLTLDVWEHAYYLDYQNRRPDYVQAFFEHLVNWDFVAENFASA